MSDPNMELAHDATVKSHAAAESDLSFYKSRHEPLTMTWKDVHFTVKTKAGESELLCGISGKASPGELLAIMGPSGAGKSTMMNVLASRAPYGTSTGSLMINGHNPKQYTKKIAYVMQDDALFVHLTPRETLEFTANMKLPDTPPEERKNIVESVLNLLGLEDSADRRIATIPGEKKRVAVAVELVSAPSLIFLDEPTSHLDAYSAYTLVKHLRQLAHAGSTIVCTIHQPSSEVFDMFDKVMLLARGKCVYNGPVKDVVPHFALADLCCKENYNPADFAMDKLQLCSDEELQPLVDVTTKNSEAVIGGDVEDVPEPEKNPQASYATQCALLTKREFMSFIRDHELLVVRFGMSLIQALLVGFFFFGAGGKWGDDDVAADQSTAIRNHWSSVQFMGINAMFLSAQPMLLAFPNERPVFLREYATRTYSTVPYLLAKTVVEIPSATAQVVMSYLVAYWMVDMQGNWLYLVLATTGLGLTTSSTALLIGALTTRPEDALNAAPLAYMPQMLASGVFLSVDGMPVWMRWVQWICPLKYGIGLVSLAEFAPAHVPDSRQAGVDFLLEASDIEADDWWWYAIILAGLFVFFRVVTAIVLTRRAGTFA